MEQTTGNNNAALAGGAAIGAALTVLGLHYAGLSLENSDYTLVLGGGIALGSFVSEVIRKKLRMKKNVEDTNPTVPDDTGRV